LLADPPGYVEPESHALVFSSLLGVFLGLVERPEDLALLVLWDPDALVGHCYLQAQVASHFGFEELRLDLKRRIPAEKT